MFKKALKYDVLGMHESDSEDEEFDVAAFIAKRRGDQRYERDYEESESEEESEMSDESDDSVDRPTVPIITKEERREMAKNSDFKCQVCPHKLFTNQETLDQHLGSSVCYMLFWDLLILTCTF